jgi:hypothetical protein
VCRREKQSNEERFEKTNNKKTREREGERGPKETGYKNEATRKSRRRQKFFLFFFFIASDLLEWDKIE